MLRLQDCGNWRAALERCFETKFGISAEVGMLDGRGTGVGTLYWAGRLMTKSDERRDSDSDGYSAGFRSLP